MYRATDSLAWIGRIYVEAQVGGRELLHAHKYLPNVSYALYKNCPLLVGIVGKGIWEFEHRNVLCSNDFQKVRKLPIAEYNVLVFIIDLHAEKDKQIFQHGFIDVEDRWNERRKSYTKLFYCCHMHVGLG